MDRIGSWIIERLLGRGGMATVFQCHHVDHPEVKRALKVIHDQARTDSRKRFAREAEILFALHHPAVVRVVDMDFTAEQPYLVMELVEGCTLVQRLKQGPLPLPEACLLFRQLAEGLQYAHDLGIRHRDIKPGNIMLSCDGSVRLLDFGIALLEGGTRLTNVGMALGTVRYMPPEILRLDSPDGIRWDVYSTGVVLFEALTGQPAFLPPSGQTSNTSWLNVLRDKSTLPALDPGPSFPESIRNLVRQATEATPERRLSSMAAFITVLVFIGVLTTLTDGYQIHPATIVLAISCTLFWTFTQKKLVTSILLLTISLWLHIAMPLRIVVVLGVFSALRRDEGYPAFFAKVLTSSMLFYSPWLAHILFNLSWLSNVGTPLGPHIPVLAWVLGLPGLLYSFKYYRHNSFIFALLALALTPMFYSYGHRFWIYILIPLSFYGGITISKFVGSRPGKWKKAKVTEKKIIENSIMNFVVSRAL